MKPQELRIMRFAQIERFLASDMTAKEWCRLNNIANSTFYMWLKRFRESQCKITEEVETKQKNKATTNWVEISRDELALSSALACSTDRDMTCDLSTGLAATESECSMDIASEVHQAPVTFKPLQQADPIVVTYGSIRVDIPPGTSSHDVTTVLKVVASL